MKEHMVVMLIDDSRSDRYLFGAQLMEIDNTIHYVPAESCEAALHHLHMMHHLPDFIFLDIHMPRVDGWECYAEIKKIDIAKDIPIYIYSSSIQPGEMETVERIGANFLRQSEDYDKCVEGLSKILKAAECH
jgi:CheY-like chemotaxis protein